MTPLSEAPGSQSVAIIGTRGYPSFYGGFETAVRKLAPYLAEKRWTVTAYCRPGMTRDDLADADCRVRRVETRGVESTSLSTLSFGLTSTLHALRLRPSVALVMNVANGFWLPLLKARGIRTVVNVDGIEWHRAKWGRVGKFVFKMGAWMTARFADEIVVDAIAIGRYWEDNLGRSGTFIPYGGEQLPADLPTVSFTSRPYVLVVARFVPENSIEEFLSAIPAILRNLDVVLVGSAPPGSRLDVLAESAADSSPGVHRLGHVEDDAFLAALWHGAAVYFHGHSVGGTNPALVQAMAYGANIVARDTVYNREVLAEAGAYCQPNPADIAEAVVAATAVAARKSDLATRRAETHYTWDAVCVAYEQALLRQVETAGSRA